MGSPMVNYGQLEYLLQALTRNQLSAGEFHSQFVRFSHEERMILLQRLDAIVYGAAAVPASPASPPQVRRR